MPPYCQGKQVPDGDAPSEIRYGCAGPTHRFVPHIGAHLDLGHFGIEAGVGAPYSRLVLRRGLDNPLDSSIAASTERATEYRPGWSLHLAGTIDYVEFLPPFGLAYRVEQYSYDALGTGHYTAHTLALYSHLSHESFTKDWGSGHPPTRLLELRPYIVAPIATAIIIGMNAACKPATNPTC